MKLGTKEYTDVMSMFERMYPGDHTKEPRELQMLGYVYRNGSMNATFIAFRKGYAAAKSVYQEH